MEMEPADSPKTVTYVAVGIHARKIRGRRSTYLAGVTTERSYVCLNPFERQ